MPNSSYEIEIAFHNFFQPSQAVYWEPHKVKVERQSRKGKNQGVRHKKQRLDSNINSKSLN